MSMTEQEVRDEWASANIGREPTQEEIDNWTRYGSKGQISYELGGGTVSEEDEDGNIITRSMNGKFVSMTNSDGEEVKYYLSPDEFMENGFSWRDSLGAQTTVLLPEGVKASDDIVLKDTNGIEVEGAGTFLAYGPKMDTGGLLTDVGIDIDSLLSDDLQGILALSIDIPTMGMGSRVVGGQDLVDQKIDLLADSTGLHEGDLRNAQAIERGAVEVGFGVAGGPLASAAFTAASTASDQYSGKKVNWKNAFVDIGVDVATFGLSKGLNAATSLSKGTKVALSYSGKMTIEASGQKLKGDSWENAFKDSAIDTAISYAKDSDYISNLTASGLRGGYDYSKNKDWTNAFIVGGTSFVTGKMEDYLTKQKRLQAQRRVA